MGDAELRGAVEAWIADDPDPGDRAELQALLDRAFPAGRPRAGAEAVADAGVAMGAGAEADAGDARADAQAGADVDALAEVRDRFSDRLHFGTAGVRRVGAAGPDPVNRGPGTAATTAVVG